MTSISNVFRLDDTFSNWHRHLLEIGDPPGPVSLPTGGALISVLEYLEIPEVDITDIVRLVPAKDSSPLWWYLERAVHSLSRHVGRFPAPPRFAALSDMNDPQNRFFFVHVFIAALPAIWQYYRERGIPDDIVQATLADVGRNVRVHRKRTGQGGLGTADWLAVHFRGMLYQLGRLQFERAMLDADAAAELALMGLDANANDHVLSIHIPDFCGPMTPDACHSAIETARGFFQHYYPDEPIRAGVCSSWLLDPQLKSYLRSESNIICFQDRFQLTSRRYNVNESIVQFVFGQTATISPSLPRRSSLERAVAEHLDAGRDWEGRFGWFPW